MKKYVWVGILLAVCVLLWAALPANAQIYVDRWNTVEYRALTTSDVIAVTDTNGGADTSASAKIIRLSCKDWPYEQWSLGMKATTVTGKDPADSCYGRVWYLYDPGSAWSAKVTVVRLGGTPSGKWSYAEIPRPPAKPCSIKADAWGYDASTCSTTVDLKFRAQ